MGHRSHSVGQDLSLTLDPLNEWHRRLCSQPSGRNRLFHLGSDDFAGELEEGVELATECPFEIIRLRSALHSAIAPGKLRTHQGQIYGESCLLSSRNPFWVGKVIFGDDGRIAGGRCTACPGSTGRKAVDVGKSRSRDSTRVAAIVVVEGCGDGIRPFRCNPFGRQGICLGQQRP